MRKCEKIKMIMMKIIFSLASVLLSQHDSAFHWEYHALINNSKYVRTFFIVLQKFRNLGSKRQKSDKIFGGGLNYYFPDILSYRSVIACHY